MASKKAAPVNVWAIPEPDYDALSGIWRAQQDARENLMDAQADLKKRTADLRWSEKHEPNRADKIENRRARVTAAIAKVAIEEAEVEALQGEERAMSASIHEPEREFWQRVAEEVAGQVGATFKEGDPTNSTFILEGDIQISTSGREGGFEVELLTGVKKPYRNVMDGFYDETAFGYSAKVYGPRKSFSDKTYEPASISWSSYSGMKSPADARQMMRIHATSIALCEAVNNLLGL